MQRSINGMTSRNLVLLASLLTWFLACLPDPAEAGEKVSLSIAPQQAKKLVGARSATIVRALSRFDMATVARSVHPKKGVAFHAYVGDKAKQKRTARQVRFWLRDKKKYLWGSYDGTGDAIRLTGRDYFGSFVYDANYSRAREIYFNTIKSRGNTVSQLTKTYPHSILVEYYIPGRPDHEMEWKSLWLVWQKMGAQWYLVALAHDQWTI